MKQKTALVTQRSNSCETEPEHDEYDPSQIAFVAMMARLCVAVGATYWDSSQRASVPAYGKAELDIYWSGLKDVPLPIMRLAFEQIAGSATYRGLPAVGKIRDACIDVAFAEELTSAEAWKIASAAMKNMSAYDRDLFNRTEAALPEDLRECGRRLVWATLQNMESQRCRDVFCREYESIVSARRKRLTIPGGWPASIKLPHPERLKLIGAENGEAEGQGKDRRLGSG